MKRNLLSSVAVVAAAFAAVNVVNGQSMGPRPFAVGIYAGGSMPTGDFKNQADVGYHGGAFLSKALSGNVSARIDGAYSDFGKKTVTYSDAVVVYGTKLFHATLDAQYDLGSPSEIAAGGGSIPYISGGGGVYQFTFDDSCTGPGCAGTLSSETRWGINFGAGAVFFLSGFTPFVDVHFHSLTPKAGESRANIILGSFGLKF